MAAQCLSTLRFWVNSIVVHTLNPETNETAPIALIGTRKDKVSSPAAHQRISTILYDNFSTSLAWPNIIENEAGVGANGRASLFFYPVDNVKGRGDPTVQACLRDIERTIDGSDYVHEKQPLVYLQTLDKLNSLNKAFLSFDEAAGVAVKCGVPAAGVTRMLTLFHEMGMLMYHDEPELSDIVIMDPIAFFVAPVTTVICKHVPTAIDPTHHNLEVHKLCRRKAPEQFRRMTELGIVDSALLAMLLGGHEANYGRLVRLMVKFGLLVRLHSDSDAAATVSEYLVPALLPVHAHPDQPWADSAFSTCYLLFTTNKKFEKYSTIVLSDLHLNGFLPKGLFERLLGRSVTWVSVLPLVFE